MHTITIHPETPNTIKSERYDSTLCKLLQNYSNVRNFTNGPFNYYEIHNVIRTQKNDRAVGHEMMSSGILKTDINWRTTIRYPIFNEVICKQHSNDWQKRYYDFYT